MHRALNARYRRFVLFCVFLYNWVRGCRMYWVDTPGTPGGGYFDFSERMCPYPLGHDWSVKACIRNGNCGCIKGCK